MKKLLISVNLVKVASLLQWIRKANAITYCAQIMKQVQRFSALFQFIPDKLSIFEQPSEFKYLN